MKPCGLIVEDAPPDETMWTEHAPDEWDIPLWNAAVRGRADFIVTENLRDCPPPGDDGIRRHQGIVFIHPTNFLSLLNDAADRSVYPTLESQGRQFFELAGVGYADRPDSDESPPELARALRVS
jgi:hypothetical protein